MLHRRLFTSFRVAALAALVVLVTAASALAQGMYLKEIAKDGRIYVFNIQANAERFEKTGGEMGVGITMLNAGPNGETVIGDNEKALQLYFFKHNIPMAVPDAPPPAPAALPWKISGLVFGDFYDVESTHLENATPSWKDQYGFWIRRAYFTYDQTFSPTITARFRLEANGNGKLAAPVAATPFIKDAYVRWTFYGRQQVTVGIQPSLTFDFLEGVWGLRHIEKTPLDLYRMDSSRDTGVTVAGPINASATLKYQVQYGNESGNNNENDRFKGYRFAARYETNPGITIEGMGAIFNRLGNADRSTAQIFVAYRAKKARFGFQYSWQQRQAAEVAEGQIRPDATEMNVISGFGVWDIKLQKYSLFARVDRMDNPCADCSGIDYLPIATNGPFTLTIVGFEYYIHPSVRFSPNVELVNYSDPATGTKAKKDAIARVTFYWVW